MSAREQYQNDFQVVQAMMKFGGSFVKNLGKLFLHADQANQERIKRAWPEYWERYTAIARMKREDHGEDWWDEKTNNQTGLDT